MVGAKGRVKQCVGEERDISISIFGVISQLENERRGSEMPTGSEVEGSLSSSLHLLVFAAAYVRDGRKTLDPSATQLQPPHPPPATHHIHVERSAPFPESLSHPHAVPYSLR